MAWTHSPTMISAIREWGPGTNIADYLISATIEAVKPSHAKQ